MDIDPVSTASTTARSDKRARPEEADSEEQSGSASASASASAARPATRAGREEADPEEEEQEQGGSASAFPTATTASECPVCFYEVPLAALYSCMHKVCMPCACKIAFECGAACPLCRGKFTSATEAGQDSLVFYATTLEFKMRGFRTVSALCMGLANSLVVDKDGDFYIHEYLHKLPGCDPLLWLWPKTFDQETDAGMRRYEHSQRRFTEMEAALPAWRNLPPIYAKLITAVHLERMINEKLWKLCVMETHPESVAERVEDSSPDGPTEAEGGCLHLVALLSAFTPAQ